MRIQSVFHVIGLIIFFLGLSMLLPLGYELFNEKNVIFGLFLSFAITSFLGIVIFKITKIKEEIRAKEGFAVVTLGWIMISLFGMLPFLFTGSINSITDAFFETASGFTTTGASILKDVEILPRSVLLWRSQIQWLGGMGIIILSLAVLPMLGVGGMQIFKAEVPGPTHEKLAPRVKQIAKILWGVYLLMSVAEIVLLKIAGMSLYDSVNHTFACMATGGYSTKNLSIGAFNNIWIEIIIVSFMFLAGTNFATHYRALKGKPLSYFKDKEFLFYALIFIIATLFLTFDTYIHNYNSIGKSLRNSVFHSISIGTTTGFVTDNYDKWPYASQLILLTLMFFGGCAGSTGGGMKIIRVLVLIKSGFVEMRKSIHPDAVLSVKVGGKSIPNDIVSKILSFLLLYISIFSIVSIIMSALGLDIVTSIGATAACIGNIGPGLGSVGGFFNYSDVPFIGKWILSFCMILGRLELYTVLVLFNRNFWKV